MHETAHHSTLILKRFPVFASISDKWLMDISAAQYQLLHHHPYPLHNHNQEMMGGSQSDSQSLDSIIVSSKATAGQAQDKKPRPPDNEAQKCPRCDSTNTKFCYYNNYSLSQPRYFCKSCRRYWTKGGTLRNVPIGGGCRKSSSAKRPSSPSSSSSFKRAHNHDVMMTPNPLLSSLHHQLSSSYGGGLGLGLGSDRMMIANPNGVTFFNSLTNAGGGLFHNLCYGVAGGNGIGNSVSGIGKGNMGAHLPFEEAVTTTTTMKQEGMGGNESNGVWVNCGEVGSAAGGGVRGDDHLQPIRGGWNGLMADSGWHGLLNTPAALM